MSFYVVNTDKEDPVCFYRGTLEECQDYVEGKELAVIPEINPYEETEILSEGQYRKWNRELCKGS